jgi:predicted nucleic acid-binding protein
MANPFVDTDVIIRLLTNDDPVKQAEAAQLFQAVEDGDLTLSAPDTVIADAVYVLSSVRLYNVQRPQVRSLLLPLLRLPGFNVGNKRAVTRALDLYSSSTLDFSDALIVASMQRASADNLYSYDTDFDTIAGLKRLEPKEASKSA